MDDAAPEGKVQRRTSRKWPIAEDGHVSNKLQRQ